MKLDQKEAGRLKLKPGKSETIVFDGRVPGLGIGMRQRSKNWIVQCRAGRRQQRVTLGPVAGLPLADARKRAGRIIADARDGKDHQAERQAAKRAIAGSMAGLIDQ